MSKEERPILEAKHVTKKFPLANGKELIANDDISLKFYKGQTLGIVGESGCGKSTFMRMMVQLEKPTSGKIFFKEKDITKMKGEELRANRRNVQMVFQNPATSFNPKMKVRDIICEPLMNFGLIKKKEKDAIARKYLEMVDTMVQGDVNILSVFIIALIMGSILSLDRKVLLRSFGGYIPAILGGLAGAAGFGVVTGLIFGVKPIDMIIKYVLPIMGGGNGAGAVPLSQIYEQISGEPAANYYSFAIIILTIANLFCILAGALLNRLGQKKPSLTGDGTNIMPVDSKLIKEDIEVKVTMNDYAGALLLCGTIYAVGRLFSKVLLPTVFGAQIHTFAYSIIFVVVIAALGIVPANIRVAARNMQSFMVSVVALMTMVGLGFDFDLGELVAACSLSNLVIAAMIVLGAILGSAVVGKMVGFYPIDSAITAGLCMANRGGAGDIAVLGAAQRLSLIHI